MPMPLVVLLLLMPAVLARSASRTRHGPILVALSAVVLAMYAGTQLASHLAYGTGHWRTGLEAVAAAMICGSMLALRYFERLAPDASFGIDDELDPTVEMEVRAASAPARLLLDAGNGAPSWRWGVSLAAAAALAVIVSSLTLVAGPAVRPAAAGDAGLPMVFAPIGDDDAIATENDADSLDAGAVAGAEKPADVSTQIVKHVVTPSNARRECLAQVESARLFMTLARNAANASDYTRQTNTEIKRFAASRRVGPYTLQSIAQRMWYSRDEPERAAEWWTRQYARCEETRIEGGTFVVSR